MSIVIDRTEVDSDRSPIVLWDNLFSQGTLAASTESTDGEKENAVDGTTYDFWTPTALPATLSVTLGSGAPASYVGIAAHDLFTGGCTVAVEYYSGGWVELATVTPTDNKTLIIAFAETTATQFRLYITGTTPPSIGVAFIGDVVRFDTGILPAYTPIAYSDEIELLNSQTMNGQFITNRVNMVGAKTNVNLNILDRTFVEGSDFQSFRNYYNLGNPFFFASNPSELDFDVAYCWRQKGGEIKPTFSNNGIFYTTSMSLEAYVGT
jgi:hypothetical protein